MIILTNCKRSTFQRTINWFLFKKIVEVPLKKNFDENVNFQLTRDEWNVLSA